MLKLKLDRVNLDAFVTTGRPSVQERKLARPVLKSRGPEDDGTAPRHQEPKRGPMCQRTTAYVPPGTHWQEHNLCTREIPSHKRKPETW